MTGKELFHEGKSPATIAQVVAAAKWLAKNHGIVIVGEFTSKTLAGIRREGKERGRGQVDGVEREDMLRIVAFAESEKSIVGLRDAALIRLNERLPAANLGSGRCRCGGFERQNVTGAVV